MTKRTAKITKPPKPKSKAPKAKRRINACVKGKVGEREFAALLRAHGLFAAERGQQHAGGVDSPDVKCPELPNVHFEVKRVQSGNPYKWLDQAIRDKGSDKCPVVAHRKNGKDWIGIVRMGDLLRWIITVQKLDVILDPDAALLGE